MEIDNIIEQWAELSGGLSAFEKLTTEPHILQRRLSKHSIFKRAPKVYTEYDIYRVITNDGKQHILVWTGEHLLYPGYKSEEGYTLKGSSWPTDIKLNLKTLKKLLP